MKVMTRAFYALFILLFAQIATNHAQPPRVLDFQPITFESGVGERVDAAKAWLTVSEKHSDAKGQTIRLPILRFKSTAAKLGPPIVYLSGGPGESGIESAKLEIFPILMALREYGDVIVFDQRGTGSSEPSLKIEEKIALPVEATLDDAASRSYILEKAKSITASLTQKGIDLSAYNTAESADDIDDLRQALGAEKLILWGHSYGSHLGLAFIKRHQEHVAKAILGGVSGLDQRWRYPANLDELIDRLDGYLVQFPKLKREVPSLRETVVQVFSRLDKEPVTVPVRGQNVRVGKLEVQALVALRSGDQEFLKMLPLLFGQMRAGDFSFTAQMLVTTLKTREWGTAARFSMQIASGVSPTRLDEIEKSETTDLFGRGFNYPYNDPQFVKAWNVADLGEGFRSPIRSDVPVLFMSGTLDGRTSVAEAADVKKGFPNGQHVIVDGASHNFYHLSPDVLGAMRAFLESRPVTTEIRVPFDLRGPNERRLILELREMLKKNGAASAVKQLREWAGPASSQFISSYVPGTLGFILMNDDKDPAAALEIFRTGLELFPDNLFLTERTADALVLLGKKDEAIKQYEKCLTLNSLNRRPAVKLTELRPAK